MRAEVVNKCVCVQLFQLREQDVRFSNISAEDLSKAVSELSLTAHKVCLSPYMLILLHCACFAAHLV